MSLENGKCPLCGCPVKEISKRIEIWHYYMGLARREVMDLRLMSQKKTHGGGLRGYSPGDLPELVKDDGGLKENDAQKISVILFCNELIEARANHLLLELTLKQYEDRGWKEEHFDIITNPKGKTLNAMQKWYLLLKILSEKIIDIKKEIENIKKNIYAHKNKEPRSKFQISLNGGTPHHQVVFDFFQYRNKFVHVNYHSSLNQDLEALSEQKLIYMFEELGKAMVDVNTKMGRDVEKFYSQCFEITDKNIRSYTRGKSHS